MASKSIKPQPRIIGLSREDARWLKHFITFGWHGYRVLPDIADWVTAADIPYILEAAR